MDKNNINTSGPASLTEHLSALLDSEAGTFEQRRVLDELKSSDGLRQSLSSYALIGEVMRTAETTVTADSSFLAGIHAQIETEDEYHHIQLEEPANDKSSASWLRPVGGFALAASVATVAFLGFQNYQQNDTSSMIAATSATSSAIASTAVSTSATSATTTRPNASQPDNLVQEERATSAIASTVQVTSVNNETIATNEYHQADARTRMLLKHYVDSHMQYASNTAFVPSVRVIAYAN